MAAPIATLARRAMTRRVEISIEILDGPAATDCPIARVCGWADLPDLWVYRDLDHRLRTITPVRGLPTPLPNHPIDGWQPLGQILTEEGF